MGSPSPICKRVATALSKGEVALLPSDGYYMALVSAAHCEAREKLDALCGATPQKGQAELVAFVQDAAALNAWGLSLPAPAAQLAPSVWPGAVSFVYQPGSNSALPSDFSVQKLEVCCAEQSFLREVLRALSELQDGVSPPLLIGLPSHRPGKLPVTSGRWLAQSLGEEKISDLLSVVPFIIDAGPTRTGCLPTALEADENKITLVRQGPVSHQELEKKRDAPIEQALWPAPEGYGDLELIAEVPSPGLKPVPQLSDDAWAIGIGPRPNNCPDDRWIELYEDPDAFMAEYFDALAQASDAGAKTVYLRIPNDELYGRLGFGT